MAIIQNHFYNVVFKQDSIIKILMKLEDNKERVYPQIAKEIGEHIDGIIPLQKENPYYAILDEMSCLMDLLNIEKDNNEYQRKEINIQKISNFIRDINKRVNDIQTVINNIDYEKNENNQAIQLLARLKQEDISLDEIQELKYITLRFGRLPLNQENKIQYFQNEHFLYKELSRDNENIWIVYCALNNDLGEIDNIFSAINFKEIVIPNFAHGKIDDAIKELYNEQIAMEEYIEDLQLRIEKIKNENKEKILTYFQQLLYLKELFDNSKYIVDLKNQAAIYIFTPLNKKEVTSIFDMDNVSVIELPINVYLEKGINEPVLLKNNHFVRPFEILTRFKAGDHFDPTTTLTIVMMISALLLLGDLGIGVTFILLSVILKGKNAELIQRLGLASLTGGLFTATIFNQGPIYQMPFIIPEILSNNVVMKLVFFIVINLAVYIAMMMIKNISRKKAVIKGGV